MKIEVHHNCADFDSYRAARVKSLFNAESGCNFDLEAELPVDDPDWSLGLIVGPSGAGKTSMGKQFFGDDKIYDPDDWPHDKPLIDAIAPDGNFDGITAALGSVGLGSVPTWLRPFHVLSNGEKFRANLARLLCEAPDQVVVDEFTSVVDRQIAKFGALAFGKSWKKIGKRSGKQCVLLSCHYDIIDWIEPDWVFDVATGKYSGRSLWRRPKFELEIFKTDWRYWDLFEPHHYLKLPKMVAAGCYVGTVDGELVAHIGMSSAAKGKGVEARACRLVVMPEWQGAGVGTTFLNAVCQMQAEGIGRLEGRKVTTLFHTSHPGLCFVLRRDPKWRQVSCNLHGAKKTKGLAGGSLAGGAGPCAGYGGHLRAAQGFRYYGEPKK
jgi:GNAT superfamily N-acetyltransferase